MQNCGLYFDLYINSRKLPKIDQFRARKCSHLEFSKTRENYKQVNLILKIIDTTTNTNLWYDILAYHNVLVDIAEHNGLWNL